MAAPKMEKTFEVILRGFPFPEEKRSITLSEHATALEIRSLIGKKIGQSEKAFQLFSLNDAQEGIVGIF